MKRRSSFSPDSTSVIVDREIDQTAYDNVKIVADAIASVIVAATNIVDISTLVPYVTNIQTVAQNIVDVNTTATDIQSILDIANDLNGLELDGVTPKAGGSSIDTVALTANLNAIIAAATNIDDIIFMANAYPTITPSTTSVQPTEGTTLSSIYSHSDSSCMLVGGALTDNGDGTVTIAAGSARMRRNPATEHSAIDTVAMDEKILTLTSGSNIIYINYPATGSAVYAITTDQTVINMLDKLGIFFINKDASKTLVTDARFSGVDHIGKHQRYLFDTERFVRASGGFLTETGTSLHLKVDASKWYFQLNPIQAAAINTSTAGTFEYYYTSDSGATWTESDATLIDHLNYNNITSGLTALGTNKYGAHWVYLLLDKDTPVYAVVYGQAEYANEAAARTSDVPATIPPSIADVGVLLGRLITNQATTTSFVNIGSVFTQSFSTALVTNHNDLAAKDGGAAGEYYHLTLAEHTELLAVAADNYKASEIDVAVANRRKLYAKETITHNVVVDDVTTGSATITLTPTENLYGRFVITDTATLTSASGEVVLDNSIRDMIIVNNDDQDYKVWIGSGGFITVKPFDVVYLYCDGTNVTETVSHYGFNQSVTDVTVSRALGTTYTNSTGRPITVYVRLSESVPANDSQATVYINGVIVMVAVHRATSTAPESAPICFIVPNSMTYLVANVSNMTLTSWVEIK